MPITLPPALTPVGQIICTQAAAYSFLGTKASTNATLGNGTLRYTAIWVPEPVTLDRIGCEVTAAGEAGSTIRLGIYADSGNLLPGALVLDAGTVTADSIAVKEITISQALAAGRYWLAGAVQGAPATQPTVRIADERAAVASDTAIARVASVNPGVVTTGVSGALPATATFNGAGSFSPRIFVRVV